MKLSENKNEKEIVSVDFVKENFDLLMSIYKQASDQVLNTIMQIKEKMKEVYGYNVIESISNRIKTPDSILDKLEKKNYEVNFKNIIDNINDVAGIRVVCPIKSDIYTIIEVINQISSLKIVETKDYISNPKKSGYSGYHMIVETKVQIDGKNIPVKVEIQLRTMAMDFWATNEHKIRYKTDKKLSKIDSKKLTAYAKIINVLDDKIMEIYNKQELV